MGYARRTGPGFRHEVRVAEPIFPDPNLSREEDVRRMTQAYTDKIAEFVRESPDQWLWIHRRWKTRPEGESVEDAPAALAEAAT
jgi:KDO2-lipid IV(A) lauroyltransferase